MREIASEAGVALGGAYYYFDSKNAIVLAFYDRARQEMQPQLEAALAASNDLKKRLAGMIQVKLEYFIPDRGLLTALAGRTDPADPLSPFSEQTREIREADIELFARAIDGGRTKRRPIWRRIFHGCYGSIRWGLFCSGSTTIRQDSVAPTR